MPDPSDEDRTASLMTPAKLAQLKVRPAPAASPSAWLDQMAADAGSGHVRRLLDLRQQIAEQLREPELRGVAGACQELHDALDKLDFAQLEPKGLFARVTGKGKEATAGFVAQYDRATHAADDLADEVRALQRKQQSQGAALERALVEFDVEIRAIEKIMDQGARWLQDMRNQLKSRQAAGGDAAAQEQIRQDNARCELLVARLKLLRTANSAAQEAVERCKGAAGRHAALVESVQRLVENEWKPAQQKLEAVAEQAVAAGSASEGVEPARRARKELQAALQQVVQDCGTLQAQEQAAGDMLAGLQVSLQAAA
jgi:predicted  nucleic acid-binding Zn-ribbon protein